MATKKKQPPSTWETMVAWVSDNKWVVGAGVVVAAVVWFWLLK